MWQVKATNAFWETVRPFRDKYPRRDYLALIKTIRAAILELEEKGHIEETSWDEHVLARQPFADGNHFEFHIHDDDVLVVSFKRERRHVIRMVGVFDHRSLPSG